MEYIILAFGLTAITTLGVMVFNRTLGAGVRSLRNGRNIGVAIPKVADPTNPILDLQVQVQKLQEQLEKEKITVQQKVAEGRAQLLASVNSLKIGFIITNTAGSILMMNEEAQALFETNSPNEPHSRHSARNTLEYIGQELGKNADLKNLVSSVISSKKASQISNVAYKSRFLRVYISPVIIGHEAIGASILLADTTEENILQRSKDEFFTIASHELRTPLTAIRGNTNLIQQYYWDQLKDDNIKEMISDIHSSSKRLINLVNDFLDASRLEQGRMEFKYEPISLSEILENISGEMKSILKDKKIYLKIEDGIKKLPPVKADRDRLTQICYNIIGNAVNYTSKGGITITSSESHGQVKVTISDTGKGIEPQNQSLLFRKFQQAGPSILTRDITRGTGLGLYISKLLVEKMGGEIKLEESNVDKGSSFSFTLPVAVNTT